ncbi:hypothetical protein J4475_01870 [Candidatus Woesearchaeota archaeon]|nr:hypothetical protein [Candidatus Woesearchaeota archaeon]
MNEFALWLEYRLFTFVPWYVVLAPDRVVHVNRDSGKLNRTNLESGISIDFRLLRNPEGPLDVAYLSHSRIWVGRTGKTVYERRFAFKGFSGNLPMINEVAREAAYIDGLLMDEVGDASIDYVARDYRKVWPYYRRELTAEHIAAMDRLVDFRRKHLWDVWSGYDIPLVLSA